MNLIVKPTLNHSKILSEISRTSFLSAHGHSASKEDIDNYVARNFSEGVLLKELENSDNVFYLIYHKNTIAGYSKIVLNKTSKDISEENIVYMSRLYLLEEFYGLGLGQELFRFNLELAKQNNKAGIWLAVWVENQKGISFYKKMGFKKVGDFNFKISETHSNPNHILYLEF